MTLKDRVKMFLDITQINKTKFCKNVDISPSTLSYWLSGERNISVTIANRITDYMTEFTKKLIEISA